MRSTLSENEILAEANNFIQNFHTPIVNEIKEAVKNNEWVIVGMKQNMVVTKAKKYLDAKNIKYKYIEHGSYFSMWQKRLAIKLWSGWPTFPQVFHNGKLVGGAADLQKYLP